MTPTTGLLRNPRGGDSSRREFIHMTAAGAVLLGGAHRIGAQGSPDAHRFLSMLGKDERLIVHNSRPGVIETPMELLRQHALTPKELLFIRNNQVLPGSLTLDPHSPEGWETVLTGMIDRPRTLRFEDLASYKTTEVEAVLQCSGNGRSLFAGSVKTRGTQWGRGGVGNVRWRGVALRDVIERLGIKADPTARFVAAEGADPPATPGAADFEHSLPLGDVLENALLATHMNGEPIPALHGGPLRLVVPGYYGTMNVKWLQKLRFEAEESNNRHHASRYRTFDDVIEPGSETKIDPLRTTPTWRQTIKSIVWDPIEGETVKVGRREISGTAWNDGRSEIVSVEMSIDQGASWQRAEVAKPTSRYAWRPWKASVEFPSGPVEIWARATDALGNTQPLDGSIYWNPSGYEWYGVDKVRVTAG